MSKTQFIKFVLSLLFIFMNTSYAETEKSIYCPKPSELKEWVGAYGFPFAYWGRNFQGKIFGNQEYFYRERFDTMHAQLNINETRYENKTLYCTYDSIISDVFQQKSIIINNKNDY